MTNYCLQDRLYEIGYLGQFQLLTLISNHFKSLPNRVVLKWLIIGICCISLDHLHAQDAESFVPPSPTAFELTRFDAQQPNLYTGTASVSIPLYSIPFDGWNIPITLSHFASGVKVNQEATHVGLGWSLNATASISRTILSRDDLFNPSSTALEPGYVYDSRVLDQPFTATDPLMGAILAGLIDTEPDVFSYNFFGYSGAFVLSKEQVDGTIDVIKLSEDNVKIAIDASNQTFSILTPQGFKGVFDILERSTSTSGAYQGVLSLRNPMNYSSREALINQGKFRNVTSWYLSKIISPIGREINFFYNNEDATGKKYISISQPTYGTFSSPSMFRVINEHQYLDRIEVDDELTIQFHYVDRDDIQPNDQYVGTCTDCLPEAASHLQRVIQMNVIGEGFSTLNRVISFQQSYFNNWKKDDPLSYDWLRLRLDGVSVQDQNHRFTYNYGHNGVPNKSSLGLDYFGFYNGNDHPRNIQLRDTRVIDWNGGDDPTKVLFTQNPDFSADVAMATAGSLRRVYYPTLGFSQYNYELHDYYVAGELAGNGAEAVDETGRPGNVKGGGLRIQSITTQNGPDDPVNTKMFRYRQENSIASSGLLIDLPLAMYCYFYDDGTLVKQFIEPSTIPAANSAQGSRIGYSRVEEFIRDKNNVTVYKNIYNYDNEPTTYDPAFIELTPPEAPDFEEIYGTNQFEELKSYDGNNGHVRSISQRDQDMITEVASKAFTYSETTNLASRGLKAFSRGEWQILVRYNLSSSFKAMTSSVEVKDHVTQTKGYTYNDFFQQDSETTYGSNGEQLTTRYVRPLDISEANRTAAISWLVTQNRVNELLEVTKEVNGEVVEAQAFDYDFNDASGSSQVILRKSYQYTPDAGSFVPTVNGNDFSGNPTLEEIQHFLIYDDESRPLEMADRSGILQAFLWRDNQVLLQGVNVDHATVAAAYAALTPNAAGYLSTTDEENLRNSIRVTHPNAQVSTFDSDPYVGMVKSTDPNGISTYYEFDANYRLAKIKDNDGNILESYRYEFPEVSGVAEIRTIPDVDFGALDDGAFTTTHGFTCETSLARGSKEVRIYNDGDTPWVIAGVSAPYPFEVSWTTAIIQPESYEVLEVTFVKPVTQGDYNGVITLTSGPGGNGTDVTFNVSGTYQNDPTATCNLVVTPGVVDFGQVTGSFGGVQTVELWNQGASTIQITSLSLSDNTTFGTDYDSWMEADVANAICINPDERLELELSFTPPANGTYAASLSIGLSNCADLVNAVQLTGERITVGARMVLSTSVLSFGEQTADPAIQSFTIQNSDLSSQPLNLSGINFSNPAYYIASGDPTGVMLAPGDSRLVEVGFSPSDFGYQEGAIEVVSDKTQGANVLQVSGTFLPYLEYAMSENELTFNSNFVPGIISITNDVQSNDDLVFEPIAVTDYPSDDWIVTLSQTVLVPGASATLSVQRKNDEAKDFNLELKSNSTERPSETVSVNSIFSKIRVNPTTLEFSTFTESRIEQTINIYNDGTVPLSVSGFSSTDPNFSVRPASFVVQPKSNTPVSIVYEAPDFETNTTTIAFNSNSTTVGANEIAVTATRTRQVLMALSQTSIDFGNNFTGDITEQVTITNHSSSNDDLVITDICDVNGSGNCLVTSPLNVSPTTFTLEPGRSQTVAITLSTDSFTPQNRTVRVTGNETEGPTDIQISGEKKRVLEYSVSHTTLSFNQNFVSSTITLTNDASSNDDLILNAATGFDPTAWSVTYASNVASPGQSIQLSVTRLDTEASHTDLVLSTNGTTTTSSLVELKSYNRQIRVNPTSRNFASFTGSSRTESITVHNDGTTQLSVSGYTSSNANFTVSPESFTVAANSSKTVDITYNAPNFSEASATITFNSNSHTAGGNTIAVTAQRARLISMGVSMSTIDFGTEFTGDVSQNIVITNNSSSNSDLVVTDICDINSSGNCYTTTPLTASPASFTLEPGETRAVTVTLSTSSFSAQSRTLKLFANETAGNDEISVTGTKKKIIEYTVSDSSLDFEGEISQRNITLTNSTSSNASLTVTDVDIPTGPNGPQWSTNITGSPAAPGGNISIDVTRTDDNAADTDMTITTNGTVSTSETIALNSINRVIRVGTTDLDFAASTEASFSETVTVYNDGSSLLTVSDYTSSNANFTVSPASFTVAAFGSKVVTITYDAPNFAEQNSTITFTSNSSSELGNTMSVSAQRTKRIAMVVSTTSIDFGDQFTGDVSQEITITNSNTSNANLVISDICDINSSGNCYTTTPLTASPEAFTLAPGESQTVTVLLSTSSFSQQSRTLEIMANETSGSAQIAVTGKKRMLIDYTVSSTSLSFENTAATKRLTITNKSSSNATLYVNEATVPNGEPWSIAFASGNSAAPNGSILIDITRQDVEADDETLTLVTNATETATTAIQLNSIFRKISVTPVTRTFAESTAEEFSETVDVQNLGNSTLSVTGYTSSSNFFTASPASFNVAPGGQQTVTITYDAPDFSTRTGTITFNSNSTTGLGNTVDVSAKRTQVKEISLSTTNVSVSPASSKTVLITNSGNVDANVTSIVCDSCPFILSTFHQTRAVTYPFKLSPGESFSLKIEMDTNTTIPPMQIRVNTDTTSGTLIINASGSAF